MMSGIKSRNTKPEIVVRKHLFSLGYRYRINRKIFGIRPDIVMPKWKCCIFIHGCYWHRHENCKLSSFPKSNIEFWKSKFNDNINRDEKNISMISSQGWFYGVIWECSIRNKKVYDFDINSKIKSRIKTLRTIVTLL